MDRRHFLHAAAGAATALAAGRAGAADAPVSNPAAAAFDAAVARQPLLAPFKGVSDATGDVACAALRVEGRWPAALNGRFYRNGPALFERGAQRYGHWFDGDGMVQRFTFNHGRVSHLGRLVRTPKLEAERRAGRFLYNAFGTDIHPDAPPQGPDSYNVANTNALEHAGRVLAMWEGGSAFALDPADLSTRGAVTWRPGLEQVPFSAHPKVGADGHLWNIGTSGDRIVAWHVDARGALAGVQVGASPYPGGMVHDVAMTARYLVVPLPPVKLRFGESGGGFAFQPGEPLRILVMAKDDIARRRVFELPGQMVFHVGNAHERRDGSIALSYVAATDGSFLDQGARALMRAEAAPHPVLDTRSVVLDMRTGAVSAEALPGAVEFPRIDPRRIGQAARYLASAASWIERPERPANLFHGVQLRDLDTGRVDRFDYGADEAVEEHILVPRPGGTRELDGWLVGTTFDARARVTVVNVLDASRVAAGPIARARLPYALPLGFHGNFTAA